MSPPMITGSLFASFARRMGQSRHLLQKSVVGFAFWTLYHGLGPMVWFYPMNELEISGYEPFVLVWLLPILFEISPIRRLFSYLPRTFSALFQAGMLVGLASFRAPSTFLRLCLLALGTGAAMMQFTVDLQQGEWAGYTIGYFALVVARICWRTISPAWSDWGSNAAVITVFVLAMIDQMSSGMTTTERKEEKAKGRKAVKSTSSIESFR